LGPFGRPSLSWQTQFHFSGHTVHEMNWKRCICCSISLLEAFTWPVQCKSVLWWLTFIDFAAERRGTGTACGGTAAPLSGGPYEGQRSLYLWSGRHRGVVWQ
jgi:hypothetical protein